MHQVRVFLPAMVVSLVSLLAGCGDASDSGLAGGVSAASIAVVPTTLDFGEVEVGSTGTRLLTVTNSGPVPIERVMVTVSGANATEFRVTGDCPSSLPTNASCSVDVEFKPAAGGPRAADVAVATNFTAVSRSVPVTGRGRLDALAALREAANRRVDVLMIGDSNQLFGGFGWDHGFQQRLGQLYGIYATGMIGANEGGLDTPGVGSGVGYGYARIFSDDGAATGAPSALDAPMVGNQMPPLNYYYVAAGATGNGSGLSMAAGVAGLDNSAAMTAHLAYGGSPGSAGRFTPFARLGYAPYTILATGAPVSTDMPTAGPAFASLDIPAGARTGPIEFRDRDVNGGDPVRGPYVAYFYRVELKDRAAGISVHTIFGVGGYSIYDMAQKILGAPRAQLELVLGEARRLQVAKGQSPLVVMVVNAGLNDRNETAGPALGPAGAAVPDSAAAYVDNLQALVDRVESVYQANWPLTELYWLIMPSHRIADPDDPKLASYRSAALAWARGRSRTQVIDLAERITAAEMQAGGYYASGGADRNHLTPAGYEGLAALYLTAGTSRP